jgi:hypothetical protein
MKATELRELMVELLTGAAGGEETRWRECIGPVSWHPLGNRPASNWTIEPTGSSREREAIEHAARLLRAEHPYVDRG